MDERRNNDATDDLWAGAAHPMAMPAASGPIEASEGSALQQLVERQPVFVMAATVLFAVGAICVVIGAFLMG